MSQQTLFMHYRPANIATDPRGGATVAIRADGNTALVSVALCDPKDVFCRKIGRIVATGRLAAANKDAGGKYTIQVSLKDSNLIKNQVAMALAPMMDALHYE